MAEAALSMAMRNLNLNRPVSIWKEDDILDDSRVKAMVIILRTSGCQWSKEQGCLMCGYNVESCEEVTSHDLRSQLSAALTKYDGERMVKIYTSGSFLDPAEIPPEVREDIFRIFEGAEKILVESRPEFVTGEQLRSLDEGRAEVAIGLETSSDYIRENSVRKGFSFADYSQAAEILRQNGIPLRTYLLLKPPFLTEREAVEDALASIEACESVSDSISINPVNVQRETLVEALWKRGDYRPPWFWSLVEVLRRSKDLTEKRVFSAPSGAGSTRGVHNCDDCDKTMGEAVARFSLSQDPEEFSHLQCGCRGIWTALMDCQEEMATSVDVVRYLSSELEFE